MKKLLIPILFLVFLLNSCSDSADIPAFNHIENFDETAEGATTDLPDESTVWDTTADTEDAYSESESIYVEPQTTAANEETLQIQRTSEIPDSKGNVYLTFDDGPGKYTGRILEILDEYDVPATFFMVGRYMNIHPDSVKAVYGAGHIIGCHSVSHDYRGIYKDSQTITADIEEWENIFLGITGCEAENRVYRFPGGSTCSAIEKGQFAELHEAVKSLGYSSFDWTCANNDLYRVDKRDDEELTDFLKRSLEESLKRCGQPKIVLVHETVAETVEMLPWIIEYIHGEGYEFAPLSDYDGEYIFAY